MGCPTLKFCSVVEKEMEGGGGVAAGSSFNYVLFGVVTNGTCNVVGLSVFTS